MVSEKPAKGAWLGLNLASGNGQLKVRTHLSGSPCRELIHTGDEIIAVDGLRVKNSSELNAAVFGKIGEDTNFTISREGVLREVKITPVDNPMHKTKLDGKGNKVWESIKRSMR